MASASAVSGEKETLAVRNDEAEASSQTDTTRQPRPGEKPGVSYHFVTREEFQRLVAEGAFLEHATFGGNMYGTSAKAVEDVSKPGPDGRRQRALLDIDTQGVKLIKANHAHLQPLFVFIAPPSISALRSRLTARGTDDDEAIGRRLAMAASEMAYARAGHHDVIVKNDSVDRAYGILKAAIQGTLQGKGDDMPEEEEEEKALRSKAPSS